MPECDRVLLQKTLLSPEQQFRLQIPVSSRKGLDSADKTPLEGPHSTGWSSGEQVSAQGPNKEIMSADHITNNTYVFYLRII